MRRSIAKKDFYQLLNVARDASKDEINKSFEELAKIFDPNSHFFDDIIQEDLTEEHNEIFTLIRIAHQTLIDDNSRKVYDESIMTRGEESKQ